MLCLGLGKGQGEPKVPKASQAASGRGKDQPPARRSWPGQSMSPLLRDALPLLSLLPFPGTHQDAARP